MKISSFDIFLIQKLNSVAVTITKDPSMIARMNVIQNKNDTSTVWSDKIEKLK